MISMDLTPYRKLFNAYTELRVQENRSIRISLLNGNIVGNSRSANSGVSARVFKNGAWGFASNPDLTDSSIGSVVSAATENAAFLDSKESKKGVLQVSKAVEVYKDFSTKQSRLSQKSLVDFLKVIDEHIAEKYPKLASRTVILSTLDMEKNIVTSEGSVAHTVTPLSRIFVIMSIEKDGQPIEVHEVFEGLGNFEDIFKAPEDLYGRIERLYNFVSDKSRGIHPDAGLKTCILGSDLSGILAHEAIGHTVEADLVMSGSVAGSWLGKDVASSIVNLVDFAHSYKERQCPVPVYIDDEGTEAQDTVIIRDGVLTSFMHSKESAARFGTVQTGHARAYDFSDEPLIRMRNTAILPGSHTLDEMIASVDDGYYLMKWNNGSADLTSEFMFGITMGYEIKNGKLGRAIRDMTVSGVAFDVLKTVDMISNDMSWSTGMCGKKQSIPVGQGGPAVKCQVHVGGR